MTVLPVLYSFRRCPYAMRARLAIAVSGYQVALREVVLRDKPSELIEASPKATVPVLIQSDGTILEESLDIMLSVLDENDPELWLTPPNGTPDQMLTLIKQCDEEFKPHLDHYKYANRYEEIDASVERDAAAEFLWDLDRRLEGNPYLFGARISLADMAIVTFVRQFANVDRSWFDQVGWENLSSWLSAFLESDRFAAIMEKYGQWQVGHAMTRFG